jgi:8-oxo-dGTP pyrophosphatase MutT (NUDIX family)
MNAPSWILDLRARLTSPPPARLPPSEARQAAVLVPLYVQRGELRTLLTVRSSALPHHRGQVAFPGGGRETGEDFWSAALRESEEEVGLLGSAVLRLGELDEVSTPTGFRIVPCVGAIPNSFAPDPSPDEIEEVFSAPIRALADPSLAEDREVVLNGRRRRLRVFRLEGRLVWGVTARILQNLMARLGLPSGLDEVETSQ